MAVPLIRGSPYLVKFTINPPGLVAAIVENSNVTFLVGAKYNFREGNSVLVTKNPPSTDRFEAVVSAYNPSTGVITLSEVTNVRGSWPIGFSGPVTMNLTGERGSGVLVGPGAPTSEKGRIGDVYIDTSSGAMYLKTS